MELGEQIRARIGAEVIDQMLDDLVEGLVAMARAESERSTRARVPDPDPDCVQGPDEAEPCHQTGTESGQ